MPLPKLLFILDNYYPHIGGAEKLFQNLAEDLVRQGYTVTVLTPKSFPEYADEEVHNGVKIVRQRVPSFAQRHFFTFFSIIKAVRLASQHDLIHATIHNAAFPAWVASKITGKKAVITVHEVWKKKWFRFGDSTWMAVLFYVIERLVLWLNFDYHIAVSDSTLRDYRTLYPNRAARRIYNGVVYDDLEIVPPLSSVEKQQVRLQYGIAPADFWIVSFGRTGLSKGFEYLVEAIPTVLAKQSNARFLFVWPSAHNFITLRDQLVHRINELDTGQRVMVHDKKAWPDLLRLLQVADCVVIPSLSEGFGYAVVESCCLAERVIASDTTAIPEVIGGNYLLSKPADADSIAQSILKMARNEYLVKARPTHFTLESMVAEHIALYNSLVNHEK